MVEGKIARACNTIRPRLVDAHPQVRAARRSDMDRVRSALSILAEHRAQIVEHREVPWASITYSGARHCVTVLFAGEDAVAAGEVLIDALPDHEFTIPRRLVADATITEVEHRMHPHPCLLVHCEILLLEDV